jgi:PEGA domain-containing protein
MKRFFFLLIGIGIWINAYGLVEKRDAALNPVSVIGDISHGQERIIFNRLISLLSAKYKLVSQNRVEEARKEVERQLAIGKCTEDYCIRQIQDILQVERLFTLMMVREGTITQFSLFLAHEEDKLIKETICTDCNVSALLHKIEKLVEDIYREDSSIKLSPLTGTLKVNSRPYQPGAKILIDGGYVGDIPGTFTLPEGDHEVIVKTDNKVGSQTVTIKNGKTSSVVINLVDRIPPENEFADEESNQIGWHIAAISLTLASAALSYTAVDKYNELEQENDGLKILYENATTQAELTQIQAEYDSNKESMKKYKQNITIYSGLIALGLGWETYLFFFGGSSESEEPSTQGKLTNKLSFDFQLSSNNKELLPNINLNYRW